VWQFNAPDNVNPFSALLQISKQNLSSNVF